MWIYQAANKNRTIIISIYLLSICVGMYSIWFALSKYSLPELLEMYSPLLFTIGAIPILLLLFGYRSKVAIFVIYLLSLYVLTFLFAGFHGVELTEVLVLAHFFLLFMWVFHFLSLFERNKKLFMALMKTSIFSILFLFFLLIFNMVPSLFQDFVILFMYGQALSLVILFFYAMFTFSEFFLVKSEGHDDQSNQHHLVPRRRRSSSRSKLFITRIIYMTLIALSLFILHMLMQHWFLFLLIWVCSLFIASASCNSFSIAFSIHRLTLAFLIPLAVVLLLYDQGLITYREALLHSLESEVFFGVLLCWAIGISPILLYQLSRHKKVEMYGILLLCFLIILSPLFYVSERIETGFPFLLSFVISYIFINGAAYLQLLLNERIFQPDKRAARPLAPQEIDNGETLEKSRNMKFAYNNSKDKQERDLAISYRRLLERRELRLSEKGIKKDD